MDIYTALRQDHNKLKPLLKQLVQATEVDANTATILDEIERELIPHARAEEEILYNTIREMHEDTSAVRHSYKEHTEAELLLQTLRGLSSVGVEWKSASEKLKEAIEHHIEEEETRVFGVAREIFTEEEAEMLGDAFLKMKPKYQEQGSMKNTFDALINMLPKRIGDALRRGEPTSRSA